MLDERHQNQIVSDASMGLYQTQQEAQRQLASCGDSFRTALGELQAQAAEAITLVRDKQLAVLDAVRKYAQKPCRPHERLQVTMFECRREHPGLGPGGAAYWKVQFGGDNGVKGMGDSPAEACEDFDRNWTKANSRVVCSPGVDLPSDKQP